MKAKTLIIITAATLAIGGIAALHPGDCPMKDVKPCQVIKGAFDKK